MRRCSLRTLVIAGAAALLGCRAPEAEVPAAAAKADAAVEVTTARVRPGSVLRRISAPGSLAARRESRIGPEVGGRIVEIAVREGDRVAEGDPLFRIDPVPYELALRQALARRDRAASERAQLGSDLARGRELRRSNVLAAQKLEELETRVAVAATAVREADEAVALARRNLERTLVRAPYSASVVARLEDEGTTALVQPQTVVVVLHETAQLEARAALPEVYYGSVHVGDPALLHLEGVAKPIATEVASVADAIDPATRTLLVTMPVDNRDHALKAGVFARVEILPVGRGDALVVPREALRREDGRSFVLVVRGERAVAVPVEVGALSDAAVEIARGLRVDDQVVVGESARDLAPGARVRVVAAGGAGAS